MSNFKFVKTTFANILFSSLFSVSIAQVIGGDITLSTQADVNSFTGTSITGTLIIAGSDIVDLTPLSTLTSVGDGVVVGPNALLTNLDGLNTLSFCRSLNIHDNVSLTNIDGLSNLFSASWGVMVCGNALLINLDGLGNLTSVSRGGLMVLENASLTNLDGLSNLSGFDGALFIAYNASLTNLDGLSNMVSVLGGISITGNTVLTNLDGLSNMRTDAGGLTIRNNNSLTNLDGLGSLSRVILDLRIEGNASLNSYCGLYALLSSSGLEGGYHVTDNLFNPTQQQIIDDGPCQTTAIAAIELLPKHYKLEQNYPNPFNPTTTISYDLPEQSIVSLTVYDVRGQEVATLQDGEQSPGNYKRQWSGVDYSGNPEITGVYFCQLSAGKFRKTIKMLYLK